MSDYSVPPLNLHADAGAYALMLTAEQQRLEKARVDVIKRKAGKRRVVIRRAGERVGRNASCSCGSGKKRKRCCGG